MLYGRYGKSHMTVSLVDLLKSRDRIVKLRTNIKGKLG